MRKFRCQLGKFRANFAPKNVTSSRALARALSTLKLMFGELQMSALADMIQAALMLNYNQRRVG